MTVYTFSAAVDGVDINDTAQVAALHSDEMDIYPSSIDGVVSIEFELDADCGEEAVRLALKHFNSSLPHGRVVRIDEGLVNATEIGERLVVSRETVRLWATGARREGFPNPRAVLSGGLRLWTWSAIYSWAESLGKLPAEVIRPIDDACVDWFNGQLAIKPVQQGVPAPIGTKTSFVTDRQHGVSKSWGAAVSAQADLDEFPARDGSQWIYDGVTLLQTSSRTRYL